MYEQYFSSKIKLPFSAPLYNKDGYVKTARFADADAALFYARQKGFSLVPVDQGD